MQYWWVTFKSINYEEKLNADHCACFLCMFNCQGPVLLIRRMRDIITTRKKSKFLYFISLLALSVRLSHSPCRAFNMHLELVWCGTHSLGVYPFAGHFSGGEGREGARAVTQHFFFLQLQIWQSCSPLISQQWCYTTKHLSTSCPWAALHNGQLSTSSEDECNWSTEFDKVAQTGHNKYVSNGTKKN